MSTLEARGKPRPDMDMVETIREHREDFEDLHLAEQRLIESRAGRGASQTLEELMRRYGLELKAGDREPKP